MHPHLEIGPAAHEGAGRTRMVEVDVGQRERAGLLVADRVEQRVGRGLRARVDDHVIDLPGADHMLEALMKDVDRAHRRLTLLTSTPRADRAAARGALADGEHHRAVTYDKRRRSGAGYVSAPTCASASVFSGASSPASSAAAPSSPSSRDCGHLVARRDIRRHERVDPDQDLALGRLAQACVRRRVADVALVGRVLSGCVLSVSAISILLRNR